MLIFGLLSDILQLHNINSNLQLLLKGLIIVCTVLVQERNLAHLVARWRKRPPHATATQDHSTRAGSADATRPQAVSAFQKQREDAHEAS